MEIILSFINKILRLIILTLAILPNLSSAQDTGVIQNFSDINLINKKIISNLSIADLVDQVSPSVVNITVSYRPGSPQATGYGSGFTLMKIFYGIVGWSRDFFSIGIFGVLFIVWYMILLFNRLRVLISFRSKLDPRINFIIMGCYLASFVLVFDYFLYFLSYLCYSFNSSWITKTQS